MTEVLIAASAESLMVAHLKAALPAYFPGVVIGTKVRNPRPDLFVRLARVGGVERDRFTDSPIIVFHCWALTDVLADQLARVTQALVKAAPDLNLLSGSPVDRYVEVGGLQNNPDPDSANPRYTFSAQFDIRKSVL